MPNARKSSDESRAEAYANNNLAGATWEVSISNQMRAAAAYAANESGAELTDSAKATCEHKCIPAAYWAWVASATPPCAASWHHAPRAEPGCSQKVDPTSLWHDGSFSIVSRVWGVH